MNILNVIKDLKKSKKITNKQIAQELGISESAVKQMLTNENIRCESVVKILKVLGYEVHVCRKSCSDTFIEDSSQSKILRWQDEIC